MLALLSGPNRGKTMSVGTSRLVVSGLIALTLGFAIAATRLILIGNASPGNEHYDYTSDLRDDCLRRGLSDSNMFGEPLCEIVIVEPLTKAAALKRKLWYRAIGWGKHFPADEDGYFIAKSGEFIPQSWAVSSPDDKFHRCTYPLNNYWSGPPQNKWKVELSKDTADGLPPTRCFWRP